MGISSATWLLAVAALVSVTRFDGDVPLAILAMVSLFEVLKVFITLALTCALTLTLTLHLSILN